MIKLKIINPTPEEVSALRDILTNEFNEDNLDDLAGDVNRHNAQIEDIKKSLEILLRRKK